MGGHLFQFAVLLAVLGFAATVSLWIGLPVVPLYIGAGVVLGEFLVPDEIVDFLGSLGVVFLLFSMGLEFSLRSLAQGFGRFARAGSIDWALNFPAGLLVGLALGWSWEAALLLAGVVYMSSSAVVVKCIVDFGRAARPETETILGIMVFEDLVIAVFLVIATALVSGQGGLDAGGLAWALLRAVAFVAALVVLAYRFAGPLERLFAHRSEEAFTLALFAFVLLVASSAIAAGLSEALGAFLAGIAVGETGFKERAQHTLLPFQTLFAALFFVSFGMRLDLGRVADVALPALLVVAVGLCTKVTGGILAGRATGHGPEQALTVGLSLVPKGEFSILIAAMAQGLPRDAGDVATLTALYVFALSILGPVGMRESDRLWQLIRGARRGDATPRA